MVAAAIGAATLVTGVVSANAQKNAAEAATQAQTDANNQAIAQQNKQFEAVQKLLQPYVSAGNGSLSAQQDLLGLNGNTAQQSAIDALKNSSQYDALNKQGQQSILANASATGGLRGGNVQGALAQFSPNLLNSIIQQQYSNLGGLTSIGQNAAAGVGNAGISTGNNISSLLQSNGASQAGNALAVGKANSQLANSVGSAFGTYLGKF